MNGLLVFLSSCSLFILQAKDGDKYVGVIICKLDRHKDRLRGYIAMLAVAKTHRKMSIGSNLVKMAIHAMKDMNADEVLYNSSSTALCETDDSHKFNRLY